MIATGTGDWRDVRDKQGMTESDRMMRQARRPSPADCKRCAGFGDGPGFTGRICAVCIGTGLGKIPLAELFKKGRTR